MILSSAGSLTVPGTLTVSSLTSAAGNEIVCYNTAGGLMTYATSVAGCVPSALSTKNPRGRINPAIALNGVIGLTPAIYTYKDTALFGAAEHDGLYADEVCALDERLCVRGERGEVKNYDKVGMLAYYAAAFTQLSAERSRMQLRIEEMERRLEAQSHRRRWRH